MMIAVDLNILKYNQNPESTVDQYESQPTVCLLDCQFVNSVYQCDEILVQQNNLDMDLKFIMTVRSLELFI